MRRNVGSAQLEWHWKTDVEQPMVAGEVQIGGRSLAFQLTSAALERGWWLLPGAKPWLLIVYLIKEDEYWWLGVRSQEGQPRYQTSKVHEWEMELSPEVSAGRLELPPPWVASWQLQKEKATWINLTLEIPGVSTESSGSLAFEASLGVGRQEWRTNLPAPLSHWECSLSLTISPDNHCRCEARLPILSGKLHDERLERWPPVPAPAPERDPTTNPGVGDVEPFQQLGFLTLLLTEAKVTEDAACTRFFELSNASDFYQALLKQAPKLSGLQQLAGAFRAGAEGWIGQYVPELGELTPPFNRLAKPEARQLLETPHRDHGDLAQALDQLFGMPALQLFESTDFKQQQQRLANSYAVLLILDQSQDFVVQELDKGLRVLALVQHLQLLLGRTAIEAAQQARPLLDARLFPLPQGGDGRSPPGLLLGVGQLYECAESRLGYSLGPLAETVNLLPGERQISRLHQEASVRDDRQSQLDHGRRFQQRRTSDQRSLELPQVAQRTQFNDLAEQYGADGLSQTIKGNYLVEPVRVSGQDYQPIEAARQEAQHLFDEAIGQLRQKVRQAREWVVQTRWESSRWQRLSNCSEQSRRGFHYWLLERREARLRHFGPRLFLYWSLQAPARSFIDQLNAETGQRWQLPAAPWESLPDDAGVATPAALTQADYIRLANRYGLQLILQAPQEKLSSSHLVVANPAGMGSQLEIPDGYLAMSLTYACIAGSQGYLLVGGQVFDLAQPKSVTLGGIAGKLAVSLAGTLAGQQVSVRLDYTARTYTVRRALWQARAYAQLMEGYQQARSTLCEALRSFNAARVGGLAERLVDRLVGAILEAIQSHYPDQEGLLQRRALQLEPWLRRVLPWQQAVLGQVSKDNPGDWVPLNRQSGDEFEALLGADELRLTIPLESAEAERFCYMLQSGGRLWLGQPGRAPVFAQDRSLQIFWDDVRDQPLAPDHRWTFHVDTCHRYLNDMLGLLPPCADI
ncbi:hypothetical protein [Pseudomonas sp. EpS/L25]|uniref:hypothetical protein n=1 Tax=Pseudomonas sp. EpS/L25 TaxID=1749078 RepID=UPI0007436EBB|nr:hypothetical protein [Pseudomonas sp. EpS/L25]KUM43055.1 hypothetical protein AR540_04665 [Pseudomonas sp. EpS/L25]